MHVNVVVAIVELLEDQLAEREQRERALETALQNAKAHRVPEPVPEPAPAPTPAPPPMELEEVHDAPIHPAASSETLGRHLLEFCENGGHLVSRHGLSEALRSLPDTDRAKRMESKVLRMFDGLHNEGPFGDDPDRKLVAAHAQSQLAKLIVLIAHGERKEQINFALSAMNRKGLPLAVTSALAEETLAFAGAYLFSRFHPIQCRQVQSGLYHLTFLLLNSHFVFVPLACQQHKYSVIPLKIQAAVAISMLR